MEELNDIRARLERLERMLRSTAPTDAKPGPEGTLDTVKNVTADLADRADEEGKRGLLDYRGVHRSDGERRFVWWHPSLSTDALLEMDVMGIADALSLLANLTRLQVYFATLDRGGVPKDIHDRSGLKTPGQTYNALNQLRDCGLVRKLEDGTFSVAGDKVGPVFLILAGVWGLTQTNYAPVSALGDDAAS